MAEQLRDVHIARGPHCSFIMNSLIILLLCVALSAASYAPTYYQPGFTRGLVQLTYSHHFYSLW